MSFCGMPLVAFGYGSADSLSDTISALTISQQIFGNHSRGSLSIRAITLQALHRSNLPSLLLSIPGPHCKNGSISSSGLSEVVQPGLEVLVNAIACNRGPSAAPGAARRWGRPWARPVPSARPCATSRAQSCSHGLCMLLCGLRVCHLLYTGSVKQGSQLLVTSQHMKCKRARWMTEHAVDGNVCGQWQHCMHCIKGYLGRYSTPRAVLQGKQHSCSGNI